MRLASLILTMAVVVLLSGGASMFLLYEAAIDEGSARLHDAARNRARLIEAIARHNADRATRSGESAAQDTLSQVIDAHEHSDGFGRTGEYVLAQRRGDQIVFVLTKHAGEDGATRRDPLPIDGPRATPMRRALRGESGSFIGVDYRGATVLAAYEPVAVLHMGLVAKMDLSEIRAPFVRAAWRGGAVALLAIVLSALLFARATVPLVRSVQATEAYNRTIVESVADGIMTVDTRGRITSFNPACERIFGRALGDALGIGVAELIPDFAANAQTPPNAATTGLRADGTEVQIELSVGELPGRTKQLSLLIRDVTERVRLENELRHAQKMEAIGTLASGVAHDFNNLLMGITSTAEVALKKATDSSVSEHLAQIKAAAVSGSSVTRQLLSFGRRDEAVTTSLDVNSVIAGTEHMLQHILGTDVELEVELAPEPTLIMGDRGELEQILLNLAGNSRRAMPAGGKLSLAVSNVAIDRADLVLLTVADTGTGMSEETRARIFEPFFTTNEPGLGTGLGLASVYGIVQRSGGRIEVDSAEGVGTTFRIYWPASAESTASAPEPAPADALRGSETVLLVEDERLVRASIREYLEHSGYRVIEADSAESARPVLADRGSDVDLLLTDIVLTGSSGDELARAFAGTPALFMSAHPTDKLVREGKLAPGTQSLQKPFTEATLLARIRELLGPAKAVAPTAPPSESTLLLVEDDAMSREACHELLSDAGFHVIAAASGAEALAASRAHGEPIDVVLTDIGLPDMSCSALISELQRLRSHRAVIFLSGRDADDPELQALLSHPCSAFVRKPIDFDTILSAVTQLLARASREETAA